MSAIDKRRVYWHSRRGMLELDLLLIPFVDQRFEQLQHEDQLLYQEFLEEEDQDLFAWLLKRQEPTEAKFKPMIELILQVAAG